jgi:hypothetical protein
MGYGMGNQQYGRQRLKSSRPVDENRLTSVGHYRAEEYPVFLEQEVDSVGHMLKQRQDRRFGQMRLDALRTYKLLQADEMRT